jgi:hypothetical protein
MQGSEPFPRILLSLDDYASQPELRVAQEMTTTRTPIPNALPNPHVTGRTRTQFPELMLSLPIPRTLFFNGSKLRVPASSLKLCRDALLFGFATNFGVSGGFLGSDQVFDLLLLLLLLFLSELVLVFSCIRSMPVSLELLPHGVRQSRVLLYLEDGIERIIDLIRLGGL